MLNTTDISVLNNNIQIVITFCVHNICVTVKIVVNTVAPNSFL